VQLNKSLVNAEINGHEDVYVVFAGNTSMEEKSQERKSRDAIPSFFVLQIYFLFTYK
jgi:hypothetical protein